jgi:hypothetical protein
MDANQLSEAVKLIKSGNKQAALPILKEITLANPRDENAWLWLYACVDRVEQKTYCLQKALEINPGNQPARKALEKLEDETFWSVQQTIAPAKAAPPRVVSARKSASSRNRNYGLLAMLGMLALSLCVCAGASLYLAQSGQISALAAGLPFFPSSTPTSSQTPTATATFTASPTPTATATFTVSPTLTPVPTGTTGPAQLVELEELESYRLQGKVAMQGGQAGFGSMSMSFTREWEKASQAQRTTISTAEMMRALGGTPNPESATSIEMIVIGKTVWMKNDKKWTRFDSLRSPIEPISLAPASEWQSLKPAGDENINGIPCKHYTVDEDALKMSGSSAQYFNAHAIGDLWVANRADLPAVILRMKIRLQMQISDLLFSQLGQPTPDPRIAPGDAPAQEPAVIIYDYEYDVSDINTDIIIEAPQMPDTNPNS